MAVLTPIPSASDKDYHGREPRRFDERAGAVADVEFCIIPFGARSVAEAFSMALVIRHSRINLSLSSVLQRLKPPKGLPD